MPAFGSLGKKGWPILLAWGVGVSILAAWFFLSALAERDEVLARAEDSMRDLALAVAEHERRVFESANMGLFAVTRWLGPSVDWDRLSADRKEWETLKAWSDHLSVVSRFVLIDDKGRVRLHPDDFSGPTPLVTERDYFLTHSAAPDPRVFVGTPVVGKITGEAIIPVTRRVDRSDGSFAGLVLATLRRQAFAEFCETLGLGTTGHATLQRGDGLILARYPFLAGAEGTKVDNSTAFPEIAAGRNEGISETVSPVDGTRRISAFRRIPGFDLLVIVGIGRDEMLAEWRRHLTVTTAAGGLGLILATALIVTLLRNRQRSEESRRAIRQWADAFTHCAHGIAMGDPATNTIVACNPAFGRMLGRPVAEIAGLPVRSIYDPQDHPVLMDGMDRADRGGHARYEAHMSRPDGSSLPVQMDLVTVRDEGGSLLYRVATAQDISERRRLDRLLLARVELSRIALEGSVDDLLRAVVDTAEKLTDSTRGHFRFAEVDGSMPAAGPGQDDLPELTVPVVRGGRTVAAIGVSGKVSEYDAADREAVEQLASMAIDLVERKKVEAALRENEKRLTAIFETSTAAIFFVDSGGIITQANRRMAEMFACSPDRLIDCEYVALVDPSEREIGRRKMLALLASDIPEVSLERHYRRFDGSEFWGHLSGRRMTGDRGETLGLVGVIMDISERKAHEVAILQKNAELERSNAELETFAYVSSHDLREPLRNVATYSTLLERRIGDRLDGDEKEFLKIVHDGALRMDNLVRDLLNFSRVGRICDPMGPLSMREAVDAALFHMQAQIKESGGRVQVEGDLPTVTASRNEIERVFYNLLGNVLKYRLPDRTPEITIGCMRDGSFWRFFVRDNGIGLQPGHNFEEKIFGLFERLHQPGEFGGGTGIGLAICRKTVERHGGRIWVESDGPGKGATFYFTLPA